MDFYSFLEQKGLILENVRDVRLRCPNLEMRDGVLVGRLEIDVLYLPSVSKISVTISTNKYLG